MYSPCHIIQLALQFFLRLKISFFHHPKVFISVNYPCNAAHLHFSSRYFFTANFFPDVRWLLLQITS